MWPLDLPFETWRAIIDWLRTQDIGYCQQHATDLERRLDETPADQTMVHMNLNDDVFLRSVNWACVALGIPRPTGRQ
jgi:hypothetical protein